jgi:hypothetical protein
MKSAIHDTPPVHHTLLKPDEESKLAEETLAEKLQTVIGHLPPEGVTLAEIRDLFGQDGLLLLTIFLTIPFMVPVSIPGVSTVFGAAILLIGVSRLLGRRLWLPKRFQDRVLPAAKLRASLTRGLGILRRLERLTRPHRMPAWAAGPLPSAALILGAALLMAPFGFVPFSNTLPGLAVLLLALGLLERDGGCILMGHVVNVVTLVYFAVLLAGGGALIRELFQHWASR